MRIQTGNMTHNRAVYEFARKRVCCFEALDTQADGLECTRCEMASGAKPSGYTTVHRGCGGRCHHWRWTIKPHEHRLKPTLPQKKNWPEDEEAQKKELRKQFKDPFWQHVLGCCVGPPECQQCSG